jgi:hypothetical protein
MTKAQWDARSGLVADAMKVFTRPFVTPLIHEPPHPTECADHEQGEAPHMRDAPPVIGTGSYIEREKINIITCEHVARHRPLSHQFFNNPKLVPAPDPCRIDPDPVDAALIPIDTGTWNSIPHVARPISMSKFAPRHQPVQDELLFFRGIAGENIYVGFGGVDSIMSGYCSQEKHSSGNHTIFEILWNPQQSALTPGTDPEAKARVKYDNPKGFSGSLVWNTKFVELGCNINAWQPDGAVITGLVQRWGRSTGTLSAWRVEHLLAWL